MPPAPQKPTEDTPAAQIDLAIIRRAALLLVAHCHDNAVRGGWWHDLYSGKHLRSSAGERPRCNVPEQLCLIHAEISGGLEGFRTGAQDTCLPHRPALEVELADALIRICSLAKGLGLDLPGAITEKLAYNATPLDHACETRMAPTGASLNGMLERFGVEKKPHGA